MFTDWLEGDSQFILHLYSSGLWGISNKTEQNKRHSPSKIGSKQELWEMHWGKCLGVENILASGLWWRVCYAHALTWELHPNAINSVLHIATSLPALGEWALGIFLSGSLQVPEKLDGKTMSPTTMGFKGKDPSQNWSLFWFIQLSPGYLQLVSSSPSLPGTPHLNNWHHHPSGHREQKHPWNWQVLIECLLLGIGVQ